MAKTKAAEPSPRFETVKRFYDRGTWPLARVEKAVEWGGNPAEARAESVGDDAE